MQNGSNITTTRGLIKLARCDSYSKACTFSQVPTHVLSIVKAQRDNGKRKKPVDLVPKFGTASELIVNRMDLLQKGVHGKLADWSPYMPTRYREFDSWEIENQHAVAERSMLVSVDALSPLIQNKIREEIMSGKAQLAVDLIEVRKTKDLLMDAAAGLWHAYRDLRAGRPFATFVREMRRTGFKGYAGQKWLQYIYGVAPTYASIFDTAEVLTKDLQAGVVVLGKVKAKLVKKGDYTNPYGTESRYTVARSTGHYQYTIKDPKLLQLSQLGFTNPLAITWELLPWSFVLDWFVDVGGYINRMDYALGVSDIWWQYSGRVKSFAHVTYTKTPTPLNTQPCIALATRLHHKRSLPSKVVANSFKGLKPFTNETVRLTSTLALLNQQRDLIKKIR